MFAATLRRREIAIRASGAQTALNPRVSGLIKGLTCQRSAPPGDRTPGWGTDAHTFHALAPRGGAFG